MQRHEKLIKYGVRFLVLNWVSVLLLLQGPLGALERVSLTLHPDHELTMIDERIYSHFLEHIYHSVHGGLWDEMIWNRSFEEPREKGFQLMRDGFVMDEAYQNQILLMGGNQWADYEYTLEAQILEGQSAFAIMFRALNAVQGYQFTLGGRNRSNYSLEKRISLNQLQVLTQPVVNPLKLGQWYGIRIRCEGNRIRIWLEDQLIINTTDLSSPYWKGQIGVGVKDGRCRFRHFRVTDLDGRMLSKGETLYRQVYVPRYWQSYRLSDWSASTQDPLNSDVCMHLSHHSGGGGVQQSPMSVIKNETYSGSLWLRGSAPGGLMVRLRAGLEVLDEYALEPPSESWVEYPFTLTSNQTTQQATLQVELSSEGDVWIDQISLMSETSRQNGGFHPGLLKSLADLRPSVLRWPGGKFVDLYRWKDAIGSQRDRLVYPGEVWDDRDINALGIDEFIALCRLVRAEPLIVLNAGTFDMNDTGNAERLLRDALDLLEYCNGPSDSQWGRVRFKNGHVEPYQVKYWEIGDTRPEDMYEYLKRIETWAPALKAKDPQINILASGIYAQDDEDLTLNRQLINRYARDVDYLSLERYERNDRFAQGPNDWETFLSELRRDIAASGHPELKVCVTEWNTNTRDWRGGLYMAGLLNVFERNCDIVVLASPALLLRHTSGLSNDNALINFDHRGWFPSTGYTVMKLWRDYYVPQQINVSGRTGPLNVVAGQSNDHTWINLKMVNPTNQAVDLSVRVDTELPLHKAGLWSIRANLQVRNTMYNSDQVMPVYQPLLIEDKTVQSELPAYSACILSIRQAENTP